MYVCSYIHGGFSGSGHFASYTYIYSYMVFKNNMCCIFTDDLNNDIVIQGMYVRT